VVATRVGGLVEQLQDEPLATLCPPDADALAAALRDLLAAPENTWSEPFVLDFDWVPPEQRTVSRRKIAVHTLFHSQRHWAQLATLVRSAGFPSKFRGDILFSPAVL